MICKEGDNGTTQRKKLAATTLIPPSPKKYNFWNNNVINNKSTLDNSRQPLFNFKLLCPQGQIIDVKCKKTQ